jgi:chromosome partitioning protein
MLATLEEEFREFDQLPIVPLSVKSAESAAERTSILQYMPRSSVAAAYRDVGAWIERRQVPAGAVAGVEENIHV